MLDATPMAPSFVYTPVPLPPPIRKSDNNTSGFDFSDSIVLDRSVFQLRKQPNRLPVREQPAFKCIEPPFIDY